MPPLTQLPEKQKLSQLQRSDAARNPEEWLYTGASRVRPASRASRSAAYPLSCGCRADDCVVMVEQKTRLQTRSMLGSDLKNFAGPWKRHPESECLADSHGLQGSRCGPLCWTISRQ